MDIGRAVRNVANVANLSTPLGLLLAVVGRGRLRRQAHLFIADDVHLPLITASAMTVGSVVLIPANNLADVSRRIPQLLEHEDAHAWQYAYCLGLPFLPLYAATSAWSLLRSGDRATANHFEVQAGLERGGYRVGQKRPVIHGLKEMARRAQPWRRRADLAA